jgi:formylmethanofuran dehydrogenase subunit E
MFITHDYIEEIKCKHCEAMVPYFDILTWEGESFCECCFDDLRTP